MKTLIRYRILRRLIFFCTVRIYPFYGTQGTCGLRFSCCSLDRQCNRDWAGWSKHHKIMEQNKMSRNMTKPTKWLWAQRRLRSAWASWSSLSTWSNCGSLVTHWAHSEDWADAQADLSFRCGHTHTCHKLWTENYEIRQIFKWDLIKFCEIFIKITLELPQTSQKSLFKCKTLVITTTKCDLCLFLHKMCCKMFWKFCEIWKILWELASRWA